MEDRLPSVCSILASIAVATLLVYISDAKPNVEKRCSTCREIIGSFKEGLERTARFNFEGGDTDWEEKKLGSYSTSETRFIEILETLCKRTEYECNVFVEEVEEILEEWWSNHDRDEADFERWLCIEKARVCCPKNRYGPDCEECAGGIERPCSGNGNCKGEGTRGGNGKCKCNGGYKGDLCNVCKNGFYEADKNETDIECKACDGSCSSTCSGPGPKACTKCKGGYIWDDEMGCEDVDECKVDQTTLPCEKEQYCENTRGSYVCKNCDIACTECLGAGNDKCVACRTGFNMVDNLCEDIDECKDNPCSNVEHMECSNSPGSYFCECEDGYVSDGEVCVDKSKLTTDETEDETNDSVENDQETRGAETASHDQSPDSLSSDAVDIGGTTSGKLPSSEDKDNGKNGSIDESEGQRLNTEQGTDSPIQNNAEPSADPNEHTEL